MVQSFYKLIADYYSTEAVAYFHIDEHGEVIRVTPESAMQYIDEFGGEFPEIRLKTVHKVPDDAIWCLAEPDIDEENNAVFDPEERNIVTVEASSYYKGALTGRVYIRGDEDIINDLYWEKRLNRIVAACEVDRLAHMLSDREALLLIKAMDRGEVECLGKLDMDTLKVTPIGKVNVFESMSLFPEVTQIPLLLHIDSNMYNGSFTVPQVYAGGKRVSTFLHTEDAIQIPDDMKVKDIYPFMVSSAVAAWDIAGQPKGAFPKSCLDSCVLEQVYEDYPEVFQDLDIEKFRWDAYKMFDESVSRKVKMCLEDATAGKSTFGIVEKLSNGKHCSYDLIELSEGRLYKGVVSKEYAEALMSALPVYAYIQEHINGKGYIGIRVQGQEEIRLEETDECEEAYKYYDKAMKTAELLLECKEIDRDIMEAAKTFSDTVPECKYTPQGELFMSFSIEDNEFKEEISL